MPKYDGPSYQKNQDSQKKFKFPFYRDAEKATNKEASIKISHPKNNDSQTTNQLIKTNEKIQRLILRLFKKIIILLEIIFLLLVKRNKRNKMNLRSKKES